MTTRDTVPVRFSPGHTRLHLRELTGHDERAVAGTSTSDALALLDALLIEGAGSSAKSPQAENLVASDRDRLLVRIYQDAFGDRIENTLTCSRCDHPFDIDFSLNEVALSVETKSSLLPRALGDNHFETAEGLRFRLPNGRDECALAFLPPEEAENGLLRCCVGDDSPWPADAATLQGLLAEVAPLVDLELETRCPECRSAHTLQFDIQSYLLSALLAERTRLAQEIHRIALSYGWSFSEILSLSRRERRQFIELIDNDSAARTRRRAR